MFSGDATVSGDIKKQEKKNQIDFAFVNFYLHMKCSILDVLRLSVSIRNDCKPKPCFNGNLATVAL